MPRIVTRLAIALVATSVAASAAAAQDPAPLVGTPVQKETKKKRPDRNEITREQFQDGNYGNAYEIVQKLKGEWLRMQGASSMRGPGGAIRVYLNESSLGGLETLRSITPESIQYIHYYTGSEATSRWGADHGAGAIYVSTRAK